MPLPAITAWPTRLVRAGISSSPAGDAGSVAAAECDRAPEQPLHQHEEQRIDGDRQDGAGEDHVRPSAGSSPVSSPSVAVRMNENSPICASETEIVSAVRLV